MTTPTSGGLVVVILVSVVLLGAALAAIPVIWRGLRQAARVPAILEAVASEFAPNGGSSLRDSIDRLAAASESMKLTFEAHVIDDKALSDYTHSRIHDLMNQNQKVWMLMTLPREERDEFAKQLLARRAGDEPPKENP